MADRQDDFDLQPQVPFDKQRSPKPHVTPPHEHCPFPMHMPVIPPLQSASSLH
jgi:hypothetical protein